MEGAIRCSANYVPLTPISFLERSAVVYADRPAVIDGSRRFTWSETRLRCLRLASAISHLGIAPGDVVAVLAQNIPAMFELHFGAPMAGAVLCTLNTRHDSPTLAILLRHSAAKLLFVHEPLLQAATGSLKLIAQASEKPPLLVLILESPPPPSILNYEDLLQGGDPNFEIRRPADECQPISLNYTSGTTARPKGVLYSHRGAYLNALATVLLCELPAAPIYLWTVPMFHCNGWCIPWALAAQGGASVCLRQVSAAAIFRSIADRGVTHLAGAPTVLTIIANSAETPPSLPRTVHLLTGGAPPPPAVLHKIENLGFKVTHSYGMTETYGPATVCAWKPEWDSLPPPDRAKLKARQGVQHPGLEEVDVKDPATMESVPGDGKTMGEVMFRGNTVMSGYLKDRAATMAAFEGGWLRSGDLAVKHGDGYIELRDRAKDIIISGGENISSIEVEAALFQHPAVADAAVVARADEFWGEVPCAFVQLKEGADAARVGEKEIIEFCKGRLPHYMAPKSVVFGDLPKTSTGKTQKFFLRERARALGASLSSPTSKL